MERVYQGIHDTQTNTERNRHSHSSSQLYDVKSNRLVDLIGMSLSYERKPGVPGGNTQVWGEHGISNAILKEIINSYNLQIAVVNGV